jgi:hypothetical protein
LKRELKKQIKQDELVSSFEHVVVWVQANRDLVRNVAIALVVLAGGAWGVSAWQQSRDREAEAAFGEALAVLRAPVASELQPGAPAPAGPVHATEAERLKKATAAFDGIERRFGSHPVALRARYYAAVSRVESGDNAEAQRMLTEIAARKDPEHLEPALARLALADLLRRTGQPEKAVDAYRQLVGDPSFPLPRDHALMSLARTLEDAHKPVEARAAYKRLFVEFPTSVYAAEARRRADDLETLGG